MKNWIMKKENLPLILGVVAVVALLLIAPDLTWADGRSLEQASSSAVNQATTVARAISALGMLVAAILYNIPGMSHYARNVMGGSLLGAICAFGGPSFISLISSIFK